jgi:hypothetical protein
VSAPLPTIAGPLVLGRVPPGPTHVEAPDPYAQATLILAHVAVLLVGLNYKVGYGTSVGLFVAIGLLPLWVGAVRKYTLAPLLAVLIVAAAVSGIVLSTIAAQDHDINQASRFQMTGLLLTGGAAVVLVLWAREVLPLHRVVLLYGAGGLASAVLNGPVSWKFGFALPTTFFVLGLLERAGPRLKTAVVITILGLVGVLDGYRSYFAFCLLAATLTLWQARPAATVRVRNRWWPAILLAGIGAAVYLLTTTLLTSGYLGEEAQARSVEQIEQSGSLLAGGRPEWAATIQLMKIRPTGYGVGVIPNLEDVRNATAGLESVNVGLNQQRDRYMFGGEFRLHSILADLWSRFGLVGVALAATILVSVLRGLSFSLAQRTANTSVILAALLALWSLAFEPSYTYWVRVCVALGLVLVLRGDDAAETAS